MKDISNVNVQKVSQWKCKYNIVLRDDLSLKTHNSISFTNIYQSVSENRIYYTYTFNNEHLYSKTFLKRPLKNRQKDPNGKW